MNMPEKLLVTGGAGFIGSEFVRQAVGRGYGIAVIDKLTYAGDRERLRGPGESVNFHAIDVADADAVREVFAKEKPSAVVHWAAESHVDRSIMDVSPFIDSNVTGTHVLLETARHEGIEKFINISTDEVYGELSDEGQFHEDSPLNPNSPYSVSKAAADMLGRAYFRTYGLKVVTARPSNTYGHWQSPEKLIPLVIIKAMRDERVPVYGNGLNIREWLHVADCAEGVFALLDGGEAGEAYNIGSGQEKRNIEVVRTVLAILGKSDALIEFVADRPGHDYRYSLNTTKMKGKTGWKANISFEEGIERTVRWYVDNMSWAMGKVTW